MIGLIKETIPTTATRIRGTNDNKSFMEVENDDDAFELLLSAQIFHLPLLPIYQLVAYNI